MTNVVTDALTAKTGSRDVKFRVDILRKWARMKSIRASGTISYDGTAEIMRTARFISYEEIDMISDRLKPVMMVRVGNRWEEFPLGVYLPRTVTKREDRSGVVSWEIEAYDRSIILREDCARDRMFIAAGTSYLDAVQNILVSAGADNAMVYDASGTVLPADREFDVGTTKLEIINTLLSEINYNPVFCDADGQFIVMKYRQPSPDRIDFEYRDNDMSIICRESSSTLDVLGVPNVFIAVCDNPDLDQTFRAEWVNENLASPISIINRGVNVAIYQPEMISSQEEIDEYIKRIAFEANQIYETVEIETAINPLHGFSNVLSINKGELEGTFVESGWSFEMKAGAKMKHTVKRLVTI